MRVLVPSALHSYTGRKCEVEAQGETLAALLSDLDRRYPGLRFRIIDEQDGIRTHIHIFVNGEMATSIAMAVQPDDEVAIIMALSGG